MGVPSGLLDLRKERCARRRQFAEPRATVILVDGSFDQMPGSEPLQRARCGRAIKRNIGRQGGLIGGSADGERRKQAVLQRRHLEFAACLLEECDVDLVDSPDQKSRPL